ncbi:hypothetical protein QVD17_37431 [Tagetes erecta]|uniref:Protein kinase domain-containing protein n=1 Tax=Tagetes erecta TaxID=13708 RepID=A0AAD8JU80_TARER|nr:hypothetical protein QVD17_37431 [Tagetes erecta]
MLPERTSQNPSINEEQRHDLKEHSKAAPNYEGTSSSLKLKVEFLEIPLSDISKATNDFKDKPIGSGGFHPTKQQLQETMRATSIVGTDVYIDPEYSYEYKYKKEIDTYSFGIVLFEILSGRLAYDPIYVNENRIGIAHVARRHAKDKKLKQLIDPKLIEEVRNEIFTLNRDLNQDPFEAFFKLACECSAVAQADRPTMEVVIKKLQNALNLQEFKSATRNQ